MWQPRAIGSLLLLGMAIQAWPCFLALGALLFRNAAFPSLHPFDGLYGRLCLGSYLIILLSGEMRFANRLLPWARTE